MATGKIKALVGCQNDDCAAETSYHLDMVKLFNGQPICENCYIEEGHSAVEIDWQELPGISLEDLCE